MRFLQAWTSLGVCALALNGCFTVGDDDSGGQGGQKDETGGSAGATTGTGGSSATGGSTAGSGTGGAGGRPNPFNRAGRGGSGGTRVTGSGGTGGTDESAGAAGEGATTSTGGSTSSGGSGGKGGTGGSGGSGATGGSGGSGATGGNMPTATCAQVSDKVQSCSLFSGPFDCSLASTTPVQECINGCFQQADCNTLTGWYCGLASNSIDDCVNLCQRFRCADGSYIAYDYECDGTSDCSDGSDEKNCTKCDGGSSVPTSYLCDGVADCSDGTDEKGCPTFQCANGTSVSGVLRCDGNQDCSDGSDEKGCATRTCPQPKAGAACGDATKNLKACGILPGGVMTSCTDRTPYRACEKECYAKAACGDVVGFFCGTTADGATVKSCIDDCNTLPDYFACNSGDLVPGNYVCDGSQDCNDDSDEAGCTFTCADGMQTIQEYSTCDKTADCKDGSDEMGCMATCTN